MVTATFPPPHPLSARLLPHVLDEHFIRFRGRPEAGQDASSSIHNTMVVKEGVDCFKTFRR